MKRWMCLLGVMMMAVGCPDPFVPTCGARGQGCCSGSVCQNGLTCSANLCSTVDSGVVTTVVDSGGGCGDGMCRPGENCTSCPRDCGSCDSGSPVDTGVWGCGDRTCNFGETCATCPGDCGSCPSCTLSEGGTCVLGAGAPGCCSGGRTCANNGHFNACVAADGAACAIDNGCSSGAICQTGHCFRPCPDLRMAMACTGDVQCCRGGDGSGVTTACAVNPGEGPGATCSKVCASSGECASQCCSSPNATGLRACIHASYCANRGACTVAARVPDTQHIHSRVCLGSVESRLGS